MQGKMPAPCVPSSVGNYSIISNEVLGKGATGVVYRGVHNFTKQHVAIKAIDLSTIRDEATKSLLQNEKLGLKTVKSPCVIKLQDIIEDARFCYIVTELCQGRTLKEHIDEKKTLAQNEAMGLFRKLTEGGLALAHECMIHRDLKPANVMIDSKGNLKIIDFGYCEIIMAKKVIKTFNVGSPSYMAPQAYLRTLYSQKSDAWALGMILYEMLHGHPMDQGMDIKRFFQQLKNDSKFIEKRISPSISLEIRQTIEKALKYLPEQRSSISALKYQADRYHINLRQKNTNVTFAEYSSLKSSVKPKVTPNLKVKFQAQPQSLKRIDSENKIASKGFVSYRQFVEPQQKLNHLKMRQMTSLEDFDANSYKHQSSGSKGVAMNQKLSQFLQRTVKQNKNSVRPSRSTAVPGFSSLKINSQRELPNFPPPTKVVRQMTLQYS